MVWALRYSEKAVKQLKKLDKSQSKLIVRWMTTNIDGCEDPRAHGRALVDNLAGLWRYRVGKYRVLCELRDDDLVVLAIEVGHRSSVYRKNSRD